MIYFPRISPESYVVGKPCPLSEVPPAKILLMRQVINITVTSTNHSGNLGESKNRKAALNIPMTMIKLLPHAFKKMIRMLTPMQRKTSLTKLSLSINTGKKNDKD